MSKGDTNQISQSLVHHNIVRGGDWLKNCGKQSDAACCFLMVLKW